MLYACLPARPSVRPSLAYEHIVSVSRIVLICHQTGHSIVSMPYAILPHSAYYFIGWSEGCHFARCPNIQWNSGTTLELNVLSLLDRIADESECVATVCVIQYEDMCIRRHKYKTIFAPFSSTEIVLCCCCCCCRCFSVSSSHFCSLFRFILCCTLFVSLVFSASSFSSFDNICWRAKEKQTSL